jgi:hypothetical protein
VTSQVPKEDPIPTNNPVSIALTKKAQSMLRRASIDEVSGPVWTGYGCATDFFFADMTARLLIFAFDKTFRKHFFSP